MATPPLNVRVLRPDEVPRPPLAGIIRSTATFTDADLCGASYNDRDISVQLRRGRFVTVTEERFGQRDAVYTVGYEVPSITTLPPAPGKAATVPPKARAKAKKAKSRQRP